MISKVVCELNAEDGTCGGGDAVTVVDALSDEPEDGARGIDKHTLTALGQEIEFDVGEIVAHAFAGYTASGIPGAVAATVGYVLPAFVIVTLLALLWSKYAAHPVFSGILGSIRPAVCALVFAAFWSVFAESVVGLGTVSIVSLLLFGGCFLLSRAAKVPPAAVILLAGAAGALFL